MRKASGVYWLCVGALIALVAFKVLGFERYGAFEWPITGGPGVTPAETSSFDETHADFIRNLALRIAPG